MQYVWKVWVKNNNCKIFVGNSNEEMIWDTYAVWDDNIKTYLKEVSRENTNFKSSM